jgi:hypothetical protein
LLPESFQNKRPPIKSSMATAAAMNGVELLFGGGGVD